MKIKCYREHKLQCLVNEMANDNKTFSLNLRKAAKTIKKLVDGELKHIGEAILDGKGISYQGELESCLGFEGDAGDYKVMPALRAVCGIEVECHNEELTKYWSVVHTSHDKFVVTEQLGNPSLMLDFNHYHEALAVSTALTSFVKGL